METDFGASGGLGFTTASGFGVHAAIDLLAADPNIWTLGAGVHYVIP
jgi:3D (Asp-Asp-Asp) domain-containing protein